MRQLLLVLLFPFSILYGWITWIRNKLYDLGILASHSFHLPIISVGNLSVGGTGKTPHIEYLIRLLESNYKTATLSRGYGRKTKGFILADKDVDANSIGDEPYQFKNKFPGISVAVDEKRKNGIEELQRLVDPDLILLDDAFQHRSVRAGYSILLTEYGKLYSRDWLLPSGRLREGRYAGKRANIIIVTKCPKNISDKEKAAIKDELRPLPTQHLFFSSIEYDTPKASFEGSTLPLDKKISVLLLTGIADPKKLEHYVEEKARLFHHLRFPDHHTYSTDDLNKVRKIFDNFVGSDKIILTTEKDAMRLEAEDLIKNAKDLPIYYLPIKVHFNESDSAKFNELINAYCNKFK